MQRMWGKYFVTEETEEISEKTTCTGNQPWTAGLVENIFRTGKTEDTPQKTTCTGHSGVAHFGSWRNWRYTRENDMHRNSPLANFVENVLNVENLNTKIASQLLYLTSKSFLKCK